VAGLGQPCVERVGAHIVSDGIERGPIALPGVQDSFSSEATRFGHCLNNLFGIGDAPGLERE
jgi:hypothetical protein